MGLIFDTEKEYHFFYIFQTVTYSRLKRKLKRINLVKQIIFYHLCSYLCTQIYNQKRDILCSNKDNAKDNSLIKKDNSFIKKDNSFI